MSLLSGERLSVGVWFVIERTCAAPLSGNLIKITFQQGFECEVQHHPDYERVTLNPSKLFSLYGQKVTVSTERLPHCLERKKSLVKFLIFKGSDKEVSTSYQSAAESASKLLGQCLKKSLAAPHLCALIEATL